jgi:hypothetical protein
MKKLLLIRPISSKGTPVSERCNAYLNFFLKNDISVQTYNSPRNIKELISLYFYIYKCHFRNVFVTMPPFSINWLLCFLPCINVIIDIRDGWSLAIAIGYGETVAPQPIKARIAKFVEFMGIRKAKRTITCTHGLQNYLQQLTQRNILLAMNGVNEKDIEKVTELKRKKDKKRSKNALIKFVCAGKFSEYGKGKIVSIIKKIKESYPCNNCLIQIFGADAAANNWIYSYIEEEKIDNLSLKILPRISREKLFSEIIDSDICITIIRDPRYEYGTKIFDYILCEKPILNYFDEENNFTKFFQGYLTDSKSTIKNKIYSREENLNKVGKEILSCLK